MSNIQTVLPYAPPSGIPSGDEGAQIGAYIEQCFLELNPESARTAELDNNRLPNPPSSVTLWWITPDGSPPEQVDQTLPEPPSNITSDWLAKKEHQPVDVGDQREIVNPIIARTGNAPDEMRPVSEAPELHKVSRAKEATARSQTADINDTAYIKLPLELLHTCAHDLVVAERISSTPTSTPRELRHATQLRQDTLSWLNGAPAPFTFDACIRLLEEELLRSSDGDIAIRSLTSHIKAISNWIKNDPQSACEILDVCERRFIEQPEQYNSVVHDSIKRANRRDRAT